MGMLTFTRKKAGCIDSASIPEIVCLKNKYKNKNCYILASGTSVNRFNLSMIQDDDIVIAINRSIVLQDKVKIDYCLYTDQAFIDFLETFDKNPKIRVICHRDNACGYAAYYFSTESEYCRTHVSSVGYALEIALRVFNCKKIYIVGLDGYDMGGQIHFYSDENLTPYEKKTYIERQLHNLINDFAVMELDDEELKRIYNCNPASRITRFQFKKEEAKTNLRRVLILGNGISRTKHKDFISEWKDEIWVCNYAFREAKELKNITRVTGHHKVMVEADVFREANGLTYEIYTNSPEVGRLCRVKKFNCDSQWLRDSGTSFVVEAIVSGYDEIYLAGFDLGGKDIYSAQHERLNRECWVTRWRQIRDTFGLDKLIFIGKDHKKFIMSNLADNTYAKLYKNNKDHLALEVA